MRNSGRMLRKEWGYGVRVCIDGIRTPSPDFCPSLHIAEYWCQSCGQVPSLPWILTSSSLHDAAGDIFVALHFQF